MYKLESEEGFFGGIIIWGIFVLLLWLVGIPAVLCILLGGFAGAAVWLIIAFWRAQKSDDPPKKREEDSAIRPVRRLIQRFPGVGFGDGSVQGSRAPQRITRDPRSGEVQLARRGPIARKRPASSSLREAIRRRKENSSNQL
ncbi:hypothetical protein [Thermocoleostomius sinensis]|uniref:Uncharacterized protein n=1 Tax=Thermocoleostomius sinensis A174 TaxID=2016057 RepID=A0A9E9C7H6_9CYAN|nr:hypothetical protein [Thermocoleostomius sinensis]WAL60364.1 hypothetical protein OXH18_24910 [Thermocoleostomius sinensis A174]